MRCVTFQHGRQARSPHGHLHEAAHQSRLPGKADGGELGIPRTSRVAARRLLLRRVPIIRDQGAELPSQFVGLDILSHLSELYRIHMTFVGYSVGPATTFSLMKCFEQTEWEPSSRGAVGRGVSSRGGGGASSSSGWQTGGGHGRGRGATGGTLKDWRRTVQLHELPTGQLKNNYMGRCSYSISLILCFNFNLF